MDGGKPVSNSDHAVWKAGRDRSPLRSQPGPAESGFEIVKELVPDLSVCVGYPALRAYVKDFCGFGFTRYCGWIQTLRLCFYEKSDETLTMVDVSPVFREKGVPFFAYGYPAEFYDAPVNNFRRPEASLAGQHLSRGHVELPQRQSDPVSGAIRLGIRG